jgi:hypothetical protein
LLEKSNAVHVTVVVPTGKTVGEGKLQSTVVAESASKAVAALKLTVAFAAPDAVAAKTGTEQLILGGVTSRVDTKKEH